MTDKDGRGRNALHYCAEFNVVTDIAEALIKKKRNLTTVKDAFHITPLHLAVIAGNQPMCELFLNNKADVNAMDKDLHNVIHLATAHGHVDLLAFLAKKGINTCLEWTHVKGKGIHRIIDSIVYIWKPQSQCVSLA